MEGSNMSHFSFTHCGEKEVNLPQCSQHKRVQALIFSPFLQRPSHLPSARSTLYTPQPSGKPLWLEPKQGSTICSAGVRTPISDKREEGAGG